MELERAYDFGGDVDWQQLSDRMGSDVLKRRIARQNLHYTSLVARSRRFLSRQLIKIAAEWAFRLTGLTRLGKRNFRNVQVVKNPVVLPQSHAKLAGLRILQISDLHLDLDPELAHVVVDRLHGLTSQYDLAVLTGDFRNSTYGDFHPAMKYTHEIVQALQAPAYGILGNHDYLEMAVQMELMGVKMLLNEASQVEFQGTSLWLVGIDDSNLYKTHDIPRALRGVPDDAYKVLLSHAPETYDEAAEAGFDYFMCGHTHGGQVCLPGGIPIITHCHAPRRCARGNWEWKGMKGFTTTGTGGCGAALRLNCPPEMVIHEFCSVAA
jgi:hypothetical protein